MSKPIDTRTMRIIAFPYSHKPGFGYTLVMEWWNDKGVCYKDMRYQMPSDEFSGLLKSAKKAAEEGDLIGR